MVNVFVFSDVRVGRQFVFRRLASPLALAPSRFLNFVLTFFRPSLVVAPRFDRRTRVQRGVQHK